MWKTSIRMSGKKINFKDKKNLKKWFLQKKKAFKIDEIDVDKILVSKKEPYGINKSIKYFIGCNVDDVIRALSIKHHEMIGYVECFDSNNTMLFKVTDKKLLKNYTKIWQKSAS